MTSALQDSHARYLPPELVNQIFKYDQVNWVSHVVSLITDLYKLLIKMTFLKDDEVDYPPHLSLSGTNTRFFKALGLHADVIDFLQQLPYVNNVYDRYETAWGWPYEFVLGSSFVDYRDMEDLSPASMLFTPYMTLGTKRGLPLWCLTITSGRNRGPELILNTRNRRFHVLIQACTRCWLFSPMETHTIPASRPAIHCRSDGYSG